MYIEQVLLVKVINCKLQKPKGWMHDDTTVVQVARSWYCRKCLFGCSPSSSLAVLNADPIAIQEPN